MSANHALLGPSALSLRLTRSSAESFLDERFSPEGRLAHARATPRHPRSRMIRATRLREVRTPDRLSSRNTFGAPYMSRTSALTWDIIAASSSSRIACALGGRLLHAQWPWRVTLSAAHISDTGQAPSLREMNSNFALFADSPTAACWRRRRSLLKASRSPSSGARSRA